MVVQVVYIPVVDSPVACGQGARCSCYAGRRHSLRDTEAVPRGRCDHGDSPVARGPLFCAGRSSLTGAVVKITVVIPQLQHIETSSCVDKVVHMSVVCNDRSLTSPMVQVYADHGGSPVAVH